MPTFRATLPAPPSVNNYLHVGASGKRFLTPEHRKWKNDACLLLKRAAMQVGWQPLDVPVAVVIRINISRRRDISNCDKAAHDALERASIIVNDNLIDDARTIRTAQTASGLPINVNWCEVEVSPLAANFQTALTMGGD